MFSALKADASRSWLLLRWVVKRLIPAYIKSDDTLEWVMKPLWPELDALLGADEPGCDHPHDEANKGA